MKKHLITGVVYLLDSGCGPGDFLVNQIIPYFQEPVKVVGVDISENMVVFANQNYGCKNISFHEFDIQGELAKSEFAN